MENPHKNGIQNDSVEEEYKHWKGKINWRRHSMHSGLFSIALQSEPLAGIETAISMDSFLDSGKNTHTTALASQHLLWLWKTLRYYNSALTQTRARICPHCNVTWSHCERYWVVGVRIQCTYGTVRHTCSECHRHHSIQPHPSIIFYHVPFMAFLWKMRIL